MSGKSPIRKDFSFHLTVGSNRWKVYSASLEALRTAATSPIVKKQQLGGICSYTNKEVLINEKMSYLQQRATIIHEAIHVVVPKMSHKTVYRLAESISDAIERHEKICWPRKSVK